MPTLAGPPAQTVASPLRQVLDAHTRRTLTAAVQRIVPQTPPDLSARVEDRIARLGVRKIQEVRSGLTLFGGAIAALFSVQQLTPFHALTPAQQDAMLTRWGDSRLPQARTLYQLLRRLTLATHYADVSTHAAIGYRGALHGREPAVPWEGPAPALADHHAERDREPVLRAPATISEPVAQPLPSGIITAARHRDGAVITADAIVIGSGAGGAVAAARLAEAGKRVIILEAGEFVPSSEFTEHEGEMNTRLYAEGGLRCTDDLGVSMLQGTTVGGGTTVNWMIMLRTPEHVLDEWTRRCGLEGMTASEMAPVFDRIEAEVHARRVPEDAHSPNNRLLLDGARTLGWHVETAVINARGCVRSGFCGQGCRYDAKQGAQQTYLPRALASGATLYANTHASRIEVVRSAGGALPTKRVHAIMRAPGSTTARDVILEAPIVIVSGGAVETPLLLQRSGMGGGGVGRYLRLHPTTAVLGLHATEINGATGIPLSVMCDEFIRRDDTGYGFWLECPPLHPSLGAAALPGFGAAHAALMQQFPSIASTIALTRDGSDQDVSSGSVLLDRHGHPRINYALTRRDAANVTASIEAAARIQLEGGAREVRTLHNTPLVIRSTRDLAAIQDRSVAANRVGLFSAHVNGTARIGTNPATSGVAPDGQRHGVRGVYVCDGSMLPTGVGVNPQETIMAMSSVLTERLLAHWS